MIAMSPGGMTRESIKTSRRFFEVKLPAALPDPQLFSLIAALARLLWAVATATVDL
jgi:hypothetical protein